MLYVAINNPIRMSDFYTYENWLDYFSSRRDEKCFKSWLEDKEKWYDKYFVMDAIDILYIFDKQNGSVLEFNKDQREFVIDLKKMANKKVFKFGQFELIKKVEDKI